jgi:uncharacterized protein YjbI with pentapeptide repeats
MTETMTKDELLDEYQHSGSWGGRTVIRNRSFQGWVFQQGEFLCTDFVECDFTNAQFLGTDLRSSDFDHSTMRGATFIECALAGCRFPEDRSLQFVGCKFEALD